MRARKGSPPLTNRRRWTGLSHSAAETKRIGRALGPLLHEGDIVLFLADLGAGKTTLVQGLIKSLGVHERALSPTFIIAQTFHGKRTVHHLDCYRLTAKESLEMGIGDYLLGRGEIERGIVLIEWAERIREVWPSERMEIRLRHKRVSTDRSVFITARGPRYESIIAKLRTRLAVP